MRLLSLTLALFTAALFTAALLSSATSGDDTPKRSAELQVLDRFVGTWDFVVTNKPAGGETVTGKTFETRTWSLGGKFVQFENPQTEQPDQPEFQMLVTYDPAAKTYPGFLMSGPSRAIVTGTWDQASQTMTFRGSFSDNSGVTFVFTNRFSDADHCEASGVIKDAAGNVIVEQIQKQTRRKK